jgi:CBS domain-containing protein
LVDEEGQLQGIVTDRDLCMTAFFSDKKLSEILLKDISRGTVHTCLPNQTLLEAERLMQDAQVRRIVVVDPHFKVLGLLSLNDLAMARVRRGGIPAEDTLLW